MSGAIAELFVLVGADVAGALVGFEAVEKGMKGFGTLATGALPASLALAGAGAAIGAGFVEAAKSAAEFDAKMTAVGNNTTLTAADMDVMRQTVLSLGASAPVALDKLAEGFMHVSNFGFSAADSATILDAAMKSAVSTGGDTAKTAEVLAAAMKEFGIPAAQAADTMDMLHTAAAEGNTTLEMFSSSFGQVAAWASAVGVPLDQAAAAMSAMTRHGFDAAEAATQVKDQIAHLINPSDGAKKALEELGKSIGEDLTGVMSPAYLHTHGLVGVLDTLHTAMDKAGMSADQQTAEWMKLVPNIRGGAASFVLAGRGAEDFSSILTDLHTNLGITDQAFARSQGTAAAQWGILTNQLQILSITVGQALVPALAGLVTGLTDVVRGFLALPEPVRNGILAAVGIVGGLLAIAGTVGIVSAAIGIMVPAFAALGALFGVIGTALGAVAGILAAFALPVGLAIAAVALLVLAWQNDWGGIREIVGSAVEAIVGFWNDTLLPALRDLGGFLQAHVFPFLGALKDLYLALLIKEVQVLALVWARVLLPVLQATGGFIQTWVIKPFAQLLDWIKGILGAIMDAADTNPVLKAALMLTPLAPLVGGRDLVNALGSGGAGGGVDAATAAITGAVAKVNSVEVNIHNPSVRSDADLDQLKTITGDATLDAMLAALGGGAPAVPSAVGAAR